MTNIEAHEQDWSDLPLFPPGQWVVTDEDIAAWNDLAYMRSSVDDIIDALDTGFAEHTFDALATAVELIDAPSAEYGIDLYLPPWPHDRAADMLAAWRAQTDGVDIEAVA